MGAERDNIPKVLIDLPDERIMGGCHVERKASVLGAGQPHVDGKVLRNDRSFAEAVAEELASQSHALHSAIVAVPRANRCRDRYRPRSRGTAVVAQEVLVAGL